MQERTVKINRYHTNRHIKTLLLQRNPCMIPGKRIIISKRTFLFDYTTFTDEKIPLAPNGADFTFLFAEW